MPLGDSITWGLNVVGAYRTDLWQLMIADGLSVRMVGSQSSGPVQLGSKGHEGHGGWEIAQIDALVQGWLTDYRPDVVLLHIGTNDLLHHKERGAPQRLGGLLDHITATLPDTDVYVATIDPLGNPAMNEKVRAFNAALAQAVQTRTATGARLHLVDMNSALTRQDISADRIHPTAGGYSKMAARWYSALREAQMTRWEAEQPTDTVVESGRRMASKTASGNGKVGFLISPKSHLEFHLTVPTSGQYRLYVRAADGTPLPCSQRLVVNGGQTGVLHYSDLGFDRWTMTGTTVTLDAGPNVVRLEHDVCNAEIDSIDLMPMAALSRFAGRQMQTDSPPG
jgi:lysophospholipase L1-like esterase